MSSMSNEAQQFIGGATDTVLHANILAEQIGIQNDLHDELVASGRLTIEDFEHEAATYLLDEQTTTFEALKATVPVYQELAEHEMRLRNELADLSSDIVQLDDLQRQRRELIQRERDFVAERLPELAPRLNAIAERLEAEVMSEAKTVLESDNASLTADYNELTDLYDLAGEAWPIPKIIDLSSSEQEAEDEIIETIEEGQEVVLIDDFPEELEPTTHEVAEKVKRKFPESVLEGASEFLALLLAEEPGLIFSPEELGEILYGADEPNRTHRVAALISNYERRKVDIIGRVLYENGLAFQRGVRSTHYVDSGERLGRLNPVYRAVPLSDLDKPERIVRTGKELEWVYDGWHTVIYRPEEVFSDNRA